MQQGITLSMCAIVNLFNGGGWKKIHPKAYVEKKNILTDKSYFSCPIGGTIIPIYDKNIASQQAEIFRNKATTEIEMSFIGGWMLGGYGAYCISAQVGFGGYMSGLGVGYVVNKGVSVVQDQIKNSIISPYTEDEMNSPIYNKDVHGGGFNSDKAELPTDNDGAGTFAQAGILRQNKEQIIKEGTKNAQNQRVNPGEGTLNNPLNRNKFKTQENQIKARYGKHNYRRTEEWRSLQRDKADYNRSLGEKEYKARNMKNLKEGAGGVLQGFNPKTPAGGLFWASSIYETISDIIIASAQHDLLNAAVDPESAAKAKLGIYAEKA
ncbi:hypothetical protein G6M26_02960 [Agrobacterium tumefaciens]|nr:hypothetical protein [Agrobacterium tumefaciens]NTE17474.1 hypothetical protein [Agrobacterium tumefaciens]